MRPNTYLLGRSIKRQTVHSRRMEKIQSWLCTSTTWIHELKPLQVGMVTSTVVEYNRSFFLHETGPRDSGSGPLTSGWDML